MRATGVLLLLSAFALVGCSQNPDGSSLSLSGSGANRGTAGAGGDLLTAGSGGSTSSGNMGECSGVLPMTIRDFSHAHPDFEDYGNTAPCPGIVESTLGPDDKPVYHGDPCASSSPQTTGPNEFAQWYNDVSGVNVNIPIALQLTESSPGEFGYDNSAFFPIDGQGFGDEGNPHNFHFTTEVHTTFEYQGGEVFTFTGDDDLWLFVNRRLAIDLGGLHPAYPGTVDFDAMADQLGIEQGNVYAMDIFHAERHTDQSNFRIQTTIACFTPPPE